MSTLNTKPIKIQVRDINHNLIRDAIVKVIERKSGNILYNKKSSSGEIILNDIDNLKYCHAFRVEIEHPHYKSRPKTNAPCIRGANLHKPHTLEFHYQDRLLVSNVYVEIKENLQNNYHQTSIPQGGQFSECNFYRGFQIRMKAYYNQDSIPNKEKQTNEQKLIYQELKKETKWGVIIGKIGKIDKTKPVKDNEFFQMLKDVENKEFKGEEIILDFQREWFDKAVRIYAFIENPSHGVGNTLYFYTPVKLEKEGLIDVTGYTAGVIAIITRGIVVKVFKFASELQTSRYLNVQNRTYSNILSKSMSNATARQWYVDEVSRMKELGNRISTLEERARFHFNFRNQARSAAREKMKDGDKAEELERHRKNMAWEEWIEYVRQEKGLTKMEDIYNYTIEASQRTNANVNSKFSVKSK